jgi:hypothetical protein
LQCKVYEYTDSLPAKILAINLVSFPLQMTISTALYTFDCFKNIRKTSLVIYMPASHSAWNDRKTCTVYFDVFLYWLADFVLIIRWTEATIKVL